MNPTVRVEAGYYLIDTHAWIRQRVGDRDTGNTDLLREFTGHEAFRDQTHRMDMATRVVLWCAARGWPVAEGAPIEHDHPHLTEPVSIVLATLPQPDRRAVAIVIVDGGDPVVYPDLTTDEGYWYSVATVEIVCPTGHRMTWDGARGLIDHHGADTTITAVFGTDRYAPFQPCRLCASYADIDSGEGCDCGGWAIYCPVCGARTSHEHRHHLTGTDRLDYVVRAAVGGWLEAIRVADPTLALWCDEDGRPRRRPVNPVGSRLAVLLGGRPAAYVGPIVVTGSRRHRMASLTETQIVQLLSALHRCRQD